MSTTSIALLIPAYKAATFLPRLLRSAEAQTVPFSEIRVYDDASPDETAAVAEQFGAKVTRGANNLGCSVGKNILARETTCEWLHFHDADDELKPDFVERALPWLQREAAPDVVFFSYETRFDTSNALVGYRRFDADALQRDPLGYVLAEQINPFCGLYRRQAFLGAGGWDEDPKVLQSEDQAGHLRLALAGLSFSADPAITVVNYIREGSMTTSNLPGAARSTFEVLAKALRNPLSPPHRAIVATRLWRIAGFSAAYLDWPNADRAAALARSLGTGLPPETGAVFRVLSKWSPGLALRVRERLIRTLRPGARRGAAFHPSTAPRDA